MRSTFVVVTFIALVIIAATGGTIWAAPLMGPVITTAANPGDQYRPAVAWDNEHKRWLVVWEQDVSGVRWIVGRLINNGGVPLTDSFFISDAATHQTDPDVVYDPGHDRYLVVWVHEYSATDTDLYGRFIPWDGVDGSLQPFSIEQPSSLQGAPALEYNPPPVDEYFLVWENVEGFDLSTIRAKRLYPDSGSQVGPSYEVVGDTTYHRRHPAVAWNADASRYLVVYERFQGTAQEDVWARSLSYSGGTIGLEFGIAGYDAEENQVDVAACDGSWMVVWKGNEDPVGQIFARPVASDLTLGSFANPSAPYVNHRWPAVACNPHGHEFFLVWEVTFSTSHEGVVGALLESDGALVEVFNVLAPVAGSDLDFTRPAVSVGDFERRALVVWETDRADLAHQDLAGRWVDMSFFTDGFESGNTTRWSSAVP